MGYRLGLAVDEGFSLAIFLSSAPLTALLGPAFLEAPESLDLHAAFVVGKPRVERTAPESAADAAVRAKLKAGPAADVGRSVALDALTAAYETALGVSVTATPAARKAAIPSSISSQTYAFWKCRPSNIV